ncbi:hypothetical protein HK101_003186 [Irineochytrium annulatum]|nr:hypothetical protein HK101_003186 [Irineochytrium annulatum]
MEETYVVNEVKEACCHVAVDFKAELKTSKDKNEVLEYILPDFITRKHGYIRDKADTSADMNQILQLNHERFTVPEVLFNPSDLGLNQAGLVEAVVESVLSASPDLHGPLFANIVLTGGNVCMPGFSERLFTDVRREVPDEYAVNIFTPNE